jgi:uncharacterized protein (TIGR03083 family)
MESARLLTCLATDYARLRSVATHDLDAAVPSCPGWTVTDLVRHVGHVYLHKVECMRQQAFPDPWPPDLEGEESIALLDRAYAALRAEFAERAPTDPAATFIDHDQTVGFWIRRMAQETVIHRVDAELALGQPIAPIPDDLGADGIDEILTLFVGYASRKWPEEFEPALKDAAGRTVAVTAGSQSWLITATTAAIDVVGPEAQAVDGSTASAAAGSADTTVSGEPGAVLRWLWARTGPDDTADTVRVTGDDASITELRAVLAVATL